MALDREGAAGQRTTFSLGREHHVKRRIDKPTPSITASIACISALMHQSLHQTGTVASAFAFALIASIDVSIVYPRGIKRRIQLTIKSKREKP